MRYGENMQEHWKQLGALVRRRRKQLRLGDQKVLAATAQLGERTVTKIEAGHSETISTDTWEKLEHALNWPIGGVEEFDRTRDITPLATAPLPDEGHTDEPLPLSEPRSPLHDSYYPKLVFDETLDGAVELWDATDERMWTEFERVSPELRAAAIEKRHINLIAEGKVVFDPERRLA